MMIMLQMNGIIKALCIICDKLVSLNQSAC